MPWRDFPVVDGPFDGAVWKFRGPMVSVSGQVYRRVNQVYRHESLRAWQCENCGSFITPRPEDHPTACWCGTPRPAHIH